MNETISKKCIVCEKPFKTRKNKARGRILRVGLRKLNTLTCSMRCSKAYERIYRRVQQNIKKERLTEEEFLEKFVKTMKSRGYPTKKDMQFVEAVGRKAFKIMDGR